MGKEQDFRKRLRTAIRLVNFLFFLIFVVVGMMIYTQFDLDFLKSKSDAVPIAVNQEEVDPDLIENGIHVRTGLIDADGMFLVVNNCTNCHSAKLVTQNRMNAERWNATIKWMQETQNLWDLGENQEVIVNYLVTNYPPKKSSGRRSPLTNIDWYDLEN